MNRTDFHNREKKFLTLIKVVLREDVVRLGLHEPDVGPEVETVDQVTDLGRLAIAVDTAGPADDDQLGVGMAAVVHLGQGTDGQVRGLERLDAPDEQE